MRLIFTLFSILLLSYSANAQKITGIWRGYFSSSNGIYREGIQSEMYKYEIQIEQQSNNGLRGVTYSYKSTVFYGKAEIQGILTLPSKSVILKETKLLELKIGDKSEPCLMTCYLDYYKMGKLEILEGTFISVNIKDKGDCGQGKVYLERVAVSDFKKEDFLLKKVDTAKKSMKPLVRKPMQSNTNPTKPSVIPPAITQPGRKDNLITKTIPIKPSTSPQQKPAVPPVVKKQDPQTNAGKTNQVKKNDKNKSVTNPGERVAEEPVNLKKEEKAILPSTDNYNKTPIPKVLVERENNLVRTITTSEENIQIDLYDNGTIDNDTISVYHNNQLVVSNARLSYNAISLKIKCSKTDARHEFVIVAENLGEIPPNTALMVITVGKNKERYEVFLASNQQRNAKVVINYVPE